MTPKGKDQAQAPEAEDQPRGLIVDYAPLLEQHGPGQSFYLEDLPGFSGRAEEEDKLSQITNGLEASSINASNKSQQHEMMVVRVPNHAFWPWKINPMRPRKDGAGGNVELQTKLDIDMKIFERMSHQPFDKIEVDQLIILLNRLALISRPLVMHYNSISSPAEKSVAQEDYLLHGHCTGKIVELLHWKKGLDRLEPELAKELDIHLRSIRQRLRMLNGGYFLKRKSHKTDVWNSEDLLVPPTEKQAQYYAELQSKRHGGESANAVEWRANELRTQSSTLPADEIAAEEVIIERPVAKEQAKKKVADATAGRPRPQDKEKTTGTKDPASRPAAGSPTKEKRAAPTSSEPSTDSGPNMLKAVKKRQEAKKQKRSGK